MLPMIDRREASRATERATPTAKTAAPAPLHQRFQPVASPPNAPRSGFYLNEPETCRRNLREFLPIAIHLGALLALFYVYRLEDRAFLLTAAIAAAVLPFHYFAPFRWKQPICVLAAFGALSAIHGPIVAICVGVGGAILIGVCLSPIAWGKRAAIVLALGVVAALARNKHFGAFPGLVLPVLASLFMFRIMIFLYELKHPVDPARPRETFGDALSYFFLLPNFCFPLFPVVDYRTFRRGYFAAEIHANQRVGLKLLTRGAIHLLLYRVVSHDLLISPEDVRGFAKFTSYIVCNYLLYLHVSGQFHVACGFLHLFGFRLPDTHNRYLLATSFTDYWRRINIYWKDFMIRLVFNPVAFRLKRKPRWLTLGVATAAVFITTWFLHAYQMFWLSGSWGFSAPDALFWGILGVLVLINVQLNARDSSAKAARKNDRRPIAYAVRGLKTFGTFATIALLWSLWSSPSLADWLALLKRGLGPS